MSYNNSATPSPVPNIQIAVLKGGGYSYISDDGTNGNPTLLYHIEAPQRLHGEQVRIISCRLKYNMTAPTPTTTPLVFAVQLLTVDIADTGDIDVLVNYSDTTVNGNEYFDLTGLPYYIKGHEALYLLINLQGRTDCEGVVSFYGGYFEMDNH
jgi:hypothetical protein